MTKRKRATKKANTIFPGLPNYVGPDKGWFAFIHHGRLFEEADINGIKDRVAYVKNNKPKNEVPIRLSHIMYLGRTLSKRLSEMRSSGELGSFRVEKVEKMVMDYVERHKPNHQWRNGSLRFPDGREHGSW